MKLKIFSLILGILLLSGISDAADEQTSNGTQVVPPSLGSQAGEAARELQNTAAENYQTGAMKVEEASQKMQVQAQDAFKTLQEQWAAFSKQLQGKTQALSQQLQQQWQDFNKSFNKPKQ